MEQNLAKPRQAAALRTLVTFKFDSAFICDVSARAGQTYHLAVIMTHQEAHLKTVSSFRISPLDFTRVSTRRRVSGASPDAEDLSHRDPAQHNPVLPEAVSQVGDKYLQPSSYFILFSVSEASADSPPT